MSTITGRIEIGKYIWQERRLVWSAKLREEEIID